MARTFAVTTPENVTIDYQIAGAGSRGGAALIDILLQGLIFALLYYVRIRVFPPPVSSPLAEVLLLIFFIVVGYTMLFEWLWNGQTPGKRLCRLRAVRDQGLPLDASAVVIRNLFRVIDSLPGLYVVGIISMMATANSKRLGDLAAGTIVVKERTTPPQPQAPEIPRVAFAEEPQLDIPPLGPEEMEALRLFIDRKAELPEDIREDIAQRIAKPMFERIGYTDHTGSYTEALEVIYRTCLARQGGR
jgi:uncharacterized RDD family membrane protein YckC